MPRNSTVAVRGPYRTRDTARGSHGRLDALRQLQIVAVAEPMKTGRRRATAEPQRPRALADYRQKIVKRNGTNSQRRHAPPRTSTANGRRLTPRPADTRPARKKPMARNFSPRPTRMVNGMRTAPRQARHRPPEPATDRALKRVREHDRLRLIADLLETRRPRQGEDAARRAGPYGPLVWARPSFEPDALVAGDAVGWLAR